jgi:hypothetical protein
LVLFVEQDVKEEGLVVERQVRRLIPKARAPLWRVGVQRPLVADVAQADLPQRRDLVGQAEDVAPGDAAEAAHPLVRRHAAADLKGPGGALLNVDDEVAEAIPSPCRLMSTKVKLLRS